MRPGPPSRRTPLPAGLLVAGGTTGCGLLDRGPAAENTVEDLAAALGERTFDDVAMQPTDRAEAPQQQLDRVLGDLAGLDVTVTAGDTEEDGDTASGTLTWTWQVAGQEWTYDAPVALDRSGEQWRVDWQPSLVEPSLTDGERLGTTTLRPRRGDIVGVRGEPIVTPRPVVRFGIDKTKIRPAQAVPSARRLAALLDIDVRPYADRARASGPKAFVEAIVLREDDALQVDGLDTIPGAVGIPDEIPLAPTREFAGAIVGDVGPVTAEMVEKSEGELEAGDVAGLSGLQARYEEQLSGTEGMVVEAIGDEAGQERTLFRVEEVNGEPLRTTLEPALQRQAEGLLAEVGPASALVALRPGTGAVVVAASGPGSKGYNTATFAQYAPGSTFKAVTALALLRAGVRPGDQVSCPPSLTVDGKRFENYDDYPPGSLGEITLREAVAQSCNTALISQRDLLEEGALAEAAAALGLGVDHDLGFPAYFGQVPPPESETGRAASMIGQGTVLASPLAMATVAASVQAGHAVLPMLLPDHQVQQTAPAVPLTGPEAESLGTLLRAVVEEGSGAFLADVPGPPVLAKTGTAEFGTGTDLRTHAWMIAAQGDLAVAVFVEVGESGSRTAGPILEEFLRSVSTG
jgi:cell division protein FtsI/penicillin-binding protein 2